MFINSMMIFDWQQYFVIVLLVVTLIFLIKEILPIEITLFAAGVLPVIVGIVSTDQFFKAISNETIITIAMLFVVVKSFERTGLIHIITQKFLPKSNSQPFILLLILPVVSFFSAFFNNTPIVMMLVPLIAKWGQDQKMPLSLFLIPISFAAMLGGACTLIGTSTNLVINGLLQSESQNYVLSFFEIGKIGLPCACVGLLFLIVFSKFFLPKRENLSETLSQEIKKMISEHVVEEGCELVGKTILEIGKTILKGDFSILELERNQQIIRAPKPHEIIYANDRVVFVGDLNQIAKIHNIKGLSSVADPHFKFDLIASYYFEYTVPANSNLVGRSLAGIQFRTRYGGSVFAIYRQGRHIVGNIRNTLLKAGDVLMVLSSRPSSEKVSPDPSEIFSFSPTTEIPIFSVYRTVITCTVIIGMILLATIYTSMMLASIIAAIVLILMRLISPKKAVQSINWNLLIMIIGGFSLSFALEATGIAKLVGQLFTPLLSKNPHIFIGFSFLLTTVFTELITNTAAVLIVFPILLQSLMQVSLNGVEAVKGLAVTVALAASCSFITPIGYQTNTIVYGPGGYRYTDYFKIGVPLNIMILLICSVLVPLFWTFS